MVVILTVAKGAMMPGTGTFRIEVENPARPGERRRVPNVLVDTGAELARASSVLHLTSETAVSPRQAATSMYAAEVVGFGIGAPS